MHLGKRIVLAILLLPAAEVVVFLLIAWAIGFFTALALMVATSFAGGLLLRQVGRGHVAQMRVALRGERGAATGLRGGGPAVALAGILLLLPGFITDLVGAGLLVPPLRRRLGATIGRAIGLQDRPAGPGAVVDLAPDEWRPVPDEKLPKRE